MLLDEFPLLGPMPVLADAFAYVAGYNMRLMLIMQSKAQLRDRDLYGPDKAEAILDNCGLEVVFGTKDLKLTEELSARLGYDTVEAASRSGPRFWRSFRRDKLHMTNTDQRRALLLPQEIARLRSDEAILIRPGMFPITAKRIQYFRDKLFTRLLRAAPVVAPITVDVRMDQGKGFEPIASDAAPASPSSPPAPSPAPAPAPAPADTSAPAKPKRAPRKKADAEGEGTSSTGNASASASRAPAPAASPAPEAPEAPALKPHQADGLLGSILGAKVDLSEFGLADGKAAVAAIVGATPTVESLNRGKGRAAA